MSTEVKWRTPLEQSEALIEKCAIQMQINFDLEPVMGRTVEETIRSAIPLEQLLTFARDAMEYVEHSKACPIARGIEEPCDCGLDAVQRQWRELNEKGQR